MQGDSAAVAELEQAIDHGTLLISRRWQKALDGILFLNMYKNDMLARAPKH